MKEGEVHAEIDTVSRSYLESVVRTQRMSPTRATSFKAKPMVKRCELGVMVRVDTGIGQFFHQHFMKRMWTCLISAFRSVPSLRLC